MQKRLSKLRREILKFGVLAIFLVVPLYPKFPFVRVPGTYVSIRLEDFLIFVVTIIWLSSILPDWRKLLKDKINFSIFIFWAISLLSVISAVFLTQTAEVHIGLLHWLRRVEYLMAFFMGLSVIRSEKDLAFYIKCLFVILFLVFIYAFGQKFFNWPVITTQNYEYSKGVALRYVPTGHLISTFAGHYDLASFLILISPLFYILLFSNKSTLRGLLKIESDKKVRALLLTAIILGFWLLVNTVSRISIVSYLLSVSVALFLIRKYKAILIVIFLSIVFVGFSSNLITRYTRIFEVTIQKMINRRDNLLFNREFFPAYAASTDSSSPSPVPVIEDRSTSIRLNVEWPRAVRAFLKNPLLGTGFSSITLATDNDYLRLLGEVGILGFASFFLIIFRILKRFLKLFPLPKKINLQSAYLIAIISSLPGIFLNALFIDIFEASKFAIIFWLMMGFAVKSAKLQRNGG